MNYFQSFPAAGSDSYCHVIMRFGHGKKKQSVVEYFFWLCFGVQFVMTIPIRIVSIGRDLIWRMTHSRALMKDKRVMQQRGLLKNWSEMVCNFLFKCDFCWDSIRTIAFAWRRWLESICLPLAGQRRSQLHTIHKVCDRVCHYRRSLIVSTFYLQTFRGLFCRGVNNEKNGTKVKCTSLAGTLAAANKFSVQRTIEHVRAVFSLILQTVDRNHRCLPHFIWLHPSETVGSPTDRFHRHQQKFYWK